MEPDREREQEQSALAAAARERFVKLARGPEEKIDLAEAALLIAAEEYPGLDVPAYLARIDDLAARVRRYFRTPPLRSTRRTATRLPWPRCSACSSSRSGSKVTRSRSATTRSITRRTAT